MARAPKAHALSAHASRLNGFQALSQYEAEKRDWEDEQPRWQDMRDSSPPARMRIVGEGVPGGPPGSAGASGLRLGQPTRSPLKPDDVRPKSPGQAAFMEALRANRIVFGLAPAGAGKTYLAVWNAVRLLQAGLVDSICLFRPAIEMGSKLGFMPGTKDEKIEHYMAPLLGELARFYSPSDIKGMIRLGTLRLEALQFLRGQNLERTAAILDEGQNATHKELQAFLTRLCEGSHFTILGDVSRNENGHPDGPVLKQSDLPRGLQGGLEYYSGKFLGIPGISRTTMTAVDIARDPLVKAMLNAGL